MLTRPFCNQSAPWDKKVTCTRPPGHEPSHRGSYEPKEGYIAVVEWHVLDLRPETMRAYAEEMANG